MYAVVKDLAKENFIEQNGAAFVFERDVNLDSLLKGGIEEKQQLILNPPLDPGRML